MLTDEGRTVVERAQSVGPDITGEVSAQLSPDDARALAALLRRVADGLGLAAGVHPALAGRRRRLPG